MQNNSNNNKKNKSIHVTRLYLVLIVVSIVIMIGAAFITYGNDPRTLHVSFDEKIEKENNIQKKEIGNKLAIGNADLSKIPSDDEIEDIVNDEMPNVCDECNNEQALDCLEEYEINKILVQNPGYENNLFIELITGNDEDVYTIVIDLNNDKVLSKEGKIDESACVEGEVDMVDGSDVIYSKYINVEEK